MSLPIEETPTPDIDWTCQRIAEYLRDGLNDRYARDRIIGLQRRQERHLELVADGQQVESSYFNDQIALLQNTALPAPQAVMGIRSYDAFNVPNYEFPLLKVYRTSDSYSMGKTIRVSPVVAAYCLILPEQEELQGSMAWVSKTVNKLLLNSQSRFCAIVQEGFRAEYRTMLNEMVMPVYAFLRMYFTVKD